VPDSAVLTHQWRSHRQRGRRYSAGWPLRHTAPNQPFGAHPIEAKLVEDGIGLVDTVGIHSVVKHRQRLSGAGAAFHLLPVEKLGHGLLWFSLSSFVLAASLTIPDHRDPSYPSLDPKSAMHHAQDILVLSVILTIFNPDQKQLSRCGLATYACPLVPILSRDILKGSQWRHRAVAEKSSGQPFRWRLRRVPAPSAIPPP
jgi:hypothetical protein